MALFEAVRRGYTLEDAPDSEKLFSSKFPSLLITHRIKLKVTNNGATGLFSNFPIFRHNLGYAPAFFAFTSSDDVDYVPTAFIYVDSDNVYAEKRESSGTRYYFIYIFARPLLQTIKTDVVASSGIGVQRAQGPQIIVARNGSDIDSRDKRDFVIHPDTKTLTVHMTGYEEGGSSNSSEWPKIRHDLGYSPLFFVYFIDPNKGSAQFIWFLPNTGSSYSLESTNSDLTLPTNQPGKFCYLIMKDPL